MKKQIFLPVTCLVLGVFSASAFAEGFGATQADPAQQIAQEEAAAMSAEEAAAVSNVPLAQLKLMKKREEAKKRRDELLKLRQQNIDAMNMGAPPETAAPAQPGNE